MFIKKQLDSAILIGHSFGGAIVQLFLEQFPEKVEKMVLISSIPPTGMLFDMGHFALRHPWKFLKLGTINFRKNIHSINDMLPSYRTMKYKSPIWGYFHVQKE